jgi:hypothetical protein
VLKTRNQSLGSLCGHQHKNISPGFFSALSQLIREEGVRGLFRGLGAQTLRGFLGPGMQLPSYYFFKEVALGRLGDNRDGPLLHSACSAASALASIAFCNPADVVRTRLYNQPVDKYGKGVLYYGSADAAGKILRTEGVAAFYKGALAHYSRLGPHIVLVFVFLEQLKKWL